MSYARGNSRAQLRANPFTQRGQVEVSAGRGTSRAVTGTTPGDVLTFDGLDWVPAPGGSGSSAVGDLTGLGLNEIVAGVAGGTNILLAPNVDQVLTSNGAGTLTWIDQTSLPGGGGGGTPGGITFTNADNALIVSSGGVGTELISAGNHRVFITDGSGVPQWTDGTYALFNATATSTSLAIGPNASAVTGAGGIALGPSAVSFGSRATVIGDQARADGNEAVAIGHSADADGGSSVAIGNDANADGNSTVAIGGFSRADTDRTISIGREAGANLGGTGTQNISIGYFAGRGAYTTSSNNIFIGDSAALFGVGPYNNSIMIGQSGLINDSNQFNVHLGGNFTANVSFKSKFELTNDHWAASFAGGPRNIPLINSAAPTSPTDDGKVLTFNSGAVSWTAPATALDVTDIVLARGNVIVGDALGAGSAIAGTAGQVLTHDGTDSAFADPVDQLGFTSANQLIYGTGVGTNTKLSGVADAVLGSSATGVPEWVVGTDGQVLTWTTGLGPNFAAPTAPAATSITFVNSDNALLTSAAGVGSEIPTVANSVLLSTGPGPVWAPATSRGVLGADVGGVPSWNTAGELFGGVVSGGGTMAIGNGATASAGTTTAVGDGATASAIGAQVFGRNAIGSNTSVVSLAANVSGFASVGIGNSSVVSGDDAVALGTNAVVSATGGVALGRDAIVDTGDTHSVALGFDATTTDANQLVINVSGTATQSFITKFDTTGGAGEIHQMEVNVENTGNRYVPLIANRGSAANEGHLLTYSSTLGPQWIANSLGNTNPVVIGVGASGTGVGSITIGDTAAHGTQINTVTIGSGATTTANGTVVLGDGTTAGGTNGVAIGTGADAADNFSVAIGTGMVGNGVGTVVINGVVSAGSTGAVAIGTSAQVYSASSVAIGDSAVANAETVSIGHDAGSNFDASNVNSVNIGWQAGNLEDSSGTVLIGHSADGSDGGNIAADAIGIGRAANVAGAASGVVIGAAASSTADNSVVVGAGSSATGAASVVLGQGTASTTANEFSVNTSGTATPSLTTTWVNTERQLGVSINGATEAYIPQVPARAVTDGHVLTYDTTFGPRWEAPVGGPAATAPGDISLSQNALIVGNGSNVGSEIPSAGNNRVFVTNGSGVPGWTTTLALFGGTSGTNSLTVGLTTTGNNSVGLLSGAGASSVVIGQNITSTGTLDNSVVIGQGITGNVAHDGSVILGQGAVSAAANELNIALSSGSKTLRTTFDQGSTIQRQLGVRIDGGSEAFIPMVHTRTNTEGHVLTYDSTLGPQWEAPAGGTPADITFAGADYTMIVKGLGNNELPPPGAHKVLTSNGSGVPEWSGQTLFNDAVAGLNSVIIGNGADGTGTRNVVLGDGADSAAFSETVTLGANCTAPSSGSFNVNVDSVPGQFFTTTFAVPDDQWLVSFPRAAHTGHIPVPAVKSTTANDVLRINGTGEPEWTAISTLTNVDAGDIGGLTDGDLILGGALPSQVLPIGSVGQVLTVNVGGTAEWAPLFNTDPVVIGLGAVGTAIGGVAVGGSATIGTNQSIAIGGSADASASNLSIAIGQGATVAGAGQDAIAIGRNSNANADSTVIGSNITQSGTTGEQLFIGRNITSTTTGDDNIIIGSNISIGGAASENVVVGADALVGNTTRGHVVIGSSAKATNISSDASVAIGRQAEANGQGGVAIGGRGSVINLAGAVAGDYCVAVGAETRCTNTDSVAIGAATVCESNKAVVVGSQADIAVGDNNLVALGFGVRPPSSTNTDVFSVRLNGTTTSDNNSFDTQFAVTTGHWLVDFPSAGFSGRNVPTVTDAELSGALPGDVLTFTGTDCEWSAAGAGGGFDPTTVNPVIIGQNADFNGGLSTLSGTVAIGASTTPGQGAQAEDGSVVIGGAAKGDDNAVVVGVGAGNLTVDETVVIGRSAGVRAANNCVIVGYDADTDLGVTNAVLVGNGAGGDSALIGQVAVGALAAAGAVGRNYAITVGYNAGNNLTPGENSIAIGRKVNAGGDRAIAIGSVDNGETEFCIASAPQAIAIGANSTSAGDQAVVMGYSADIDVVSDRAIAVGESAVITNAGDAIAIGSAATCTNAIDSIAIGRSANTGAEGAVAIGEAAGCSGDYSVALGHNAVVTSDNTFGVNLDGGIPTENGLRFRTQFSTTGNNWAVNFSGGAARNVPILAAAEVDANEQISLVPKADGTFELAPNRRQIDSTGTLDPIQGEVHFRISSPADGTITLPSTSTAGAPSSLERSCYVVTNNTVDKVYTLAVNAPFTLESEKDDLYPGESATFRTGSVAEGHDDTWYLVSSHTIDRFERQSAAAETPAGPDDALVGLVRPRNGRQFYIPSVDFNAGRGGTFPYTVNVTFWPSPEDGDEITICNRGSLASGGTLSVAWAFNSVGETIEDPAAFIPAITLQRWTVTWVFLTSAAGVVGKTPGSPAGSAGMWFIKSVCD